MRQSLATLGHGLVCPLTPEQEKDEKLFFRKNTTILWELLNDTFDQRSEGRALKTASAHVTRGSDVTRILTVKNGLHHPNPTERAQSCSPIIKPKFKFQEFHRNNELIRMSKLFKPTKADMKEIKIKRENISCVKSDSEQSGEGDTRFPARRGQYYRGQSPKANLAKDSGTVAWRTTADVAQNGDHSAGNWLVEATAAAATATASSPRSSKLTESHHHPASVHCEALGPATCRHCLRTLSLAHGSFFLPQSGILTSATSTVRVPSSYHQQHHRNHHPRAQPPTKASGYPSATPRPCISMPPHPYTPHTVFQRALWNKADSSSNRESSRRTNNKENAYTLNTRDVISPGKESINQKHESDYLTSNYDEEGGDDICQDRKNEDNFDGLRIRVNFKQKSGVFG